MSAWTNVMAAACAVRAGDGFVYVVTEEWRYTKLGWVKSDPMRRLSDLQVGNPHQLTMIGVVPGSRELETALHMYYDKQHSRGEWFHHTPDLELVVERLSSVQREMGYKPHLDTAPDHEPILAVTPTQRRTSGVLDLDSLGGKFFPARSLHGRLADHMTMRQEAEDKPVVRVVEHREVDDMAVIDPRVASVGGTRTREKGDYEFPGMVRASDWRQTLAHRHTSYYGCVECGAKFKGPNAVYTHLAKRHSAGGYEAISGSSKTNSVTREYPRASEPVLAQGAA